MTTWYVIWVADRTQAKVAAALQAADFDVYFPVSVHWSRRGIGKREKPRVKIERPLLDRYMIVGLDDPDGWPEVARTENVERVLGKLDPPGVDAMFDMKAQQALGTWDYTIEPAWETGERVRLTEGAYADWTGRIERVERGEKARLELWDRMLGKWSGNPITVPLAVLEKVA